MIEDNRSGRHRAAESGPADTPSTPDASADPAGPSAVKPHGATPNQDARAAGTDRSNPVGPRRAANADPPTAAGTAATAGTAGTAESAERPSAAQAADGPAPDAPAVDAPAVDAPTTGAPGSAAAAGESRRARRHARKAARKRRKTPWWELPALVLLAIVIAIVVKTFVVQPFYIPSQSMEKTLHGCPGCHGDRILVNKPIYDLRDPHPGDIVVFHAPQGWDDEPVSQPPSNPILRTIRGFGQLIGFVPPDGQVLVKRVIATGGQTVKGDRTGRVQISTNGPGGPYRTLNEPFVYIDNSGRNSLRAFGPVTVPKGRLWVMGDHRNDSADSRYHCGPGGTDSGNDANCELYRTQATVPIDDVIGKAFVIAWPPSRWRTLGTPSTFENAAAAAAPALPSAAAVATVLPLYVVRRRRRRP